MCGERRPHPAFAVLRRGRRGRPADECEIGDVRICRVEKESCGADAESAKSAERRKGDVK